MHLLSCTAHIVTALQSDMPVNDTTANMHKDMDSNANNMLQM